MGKSHGRWVNLMVWTLLHLVKCMPQECNNRNDLPTFTGLGRYCEETVHSLNCSVGPRKTIEGDNTLHCMIRRKKGWDAYQKTLGDLSQCHYEDCEPSQLASLRVVRLKLSEYLDDDDSLPTIQLNFTVPKATVERQFYAGGILVNFSSNSQMTNGDYKFDTRYRLLDFSNYSYSSPDNDKTYQRILSFPCFMGFEHNPCQSDSYKVYNLTLISFSNSKTKEGRTTFTELSYNITIYSYYVYHPDKWKSTIAVAFFPGKKDVTVLFDPAPDSVTVTYYNVSLFNVDGDTTYRYKITGQSTKHCFKNVEDGTYYIIMMVVSEGNKCIGSCNITKSHVFTVGNPKPIHREAVAADSADAPVVDLQLVYLAVGGGVVLAFTLLAVLCYIRRKNRTESKDTETPPFTKVLLIYSNIKQENATLAREFANISKEALHVDLIHDKLDHEIPRISAAGYETWYNKKLEESLAVIILWTPGSDVKEKVGDNSYNAFNAGVTLALNSKTNDDKKVLCVYFDKLHKKTIPRDIEKEVRVFAFPEKSSQLSSFLHGKRKVPKLPVSRYTRLEEAILAINQNNSNIETSVRYLREETTGHVEKTEDLSEEKLDQEISELKDELLRKNTGNLSNSSNSSASTADNPMYNPCCPIHGQNLTKLQGNLSNVQRQYPERFPAVVHKNRHTNHFGDQRRVHSCQHPFTHDHPVHIMNSDCNTGKPFPCHERDHRNLASFNEHPEEPDERQSLIDHGYHNVNSVPNIHENNLGMLGHDIGGEDFNHSPTSNIEHSFGIQGHEYRHRSNSLQRYNKFGDDVSEHTPLQHPQFYLEEDEIPLQNIRPSQRSDSMSSVESNCSNYSKGSDSIASDDLMMSFQKFL